MVNEDPQLVPDPGLTAFRCPRPLTCVAAVHLLTGIGRCQTLRLTHCLV